MKLFACVAAFLALTVPGVGGGSGQLSCDTPCRKAYSNMVSCCRGDAQCQEQARATYQACVDSCKIPTW
jgi:hypothetical protein